MASAADRPDNVPFHCSQRAHVSYVLEGLRMMAAPCPSCAGQPGRVLVYFVSHRYLDVGFRCRLES